MQSLETFISNGTGTPDNASNDQGYLKYLTDNIKKSKRPRFTEQLIKKANA